MSAEKRGARALIVGASGQVGHHLALAAERRGIPWSGTFHKNPRADLHALDVRDAAAVARVVRAANPAFVLIPAAVAHVDRCETEARQAYEVNVVGTGHLVDAANDVGAVIVYFSSDYIFDGADGPYDERATANPLSQYGLQKLSAEHLICQRAKESLIVRTTTVYGPEPQGKNFIYRLLAALRNGREIAVPGDQLGNPTYAPVLADAVFDLLAAGERGVIHVAGSALATREEFARAAADAFGEDQRLVCSALTSELGQAAPRPLKAGLRSDVAERCLGRELLGYVEGLRLLVADGAI
jgi:dTDP-4-dehydrorhamnose reductase